MNGVYVILNGSRKAKNVFTAGLQVPLSIWSGEGEREERWCKVQYYHFHNHNNILK